MARVPVISDRLGHVGGPFLSGRLERDIGERNVLPSAKNRRFPVEGPGLVLLFCCKLPSANMAAQFTLT